MTVRKEDSRVARTGLVCGLSAYTLWGAMPLIFSSIRGFGNFEILTIRLLVSAIVLLVLVTAISGWKSIANVMRQRRLIAALLLSATLIIANWLIYIMATRSGYVMEASLGYFINPLFNVALGMIFLRERLRPVQWTAIAIAAGAVTFLAVNGGSALWVSLTLAASFSFYGLIRKVIPVSPLDGLAIENLIFVPVALLFLAVAPLSPPSSIRTLDIGLLALLGPITILPLFLFAAAAQRLSYSTLGLIQYIAPSLQFMVAIWLGESFDRAHAIAFGCIWTALAIYAAEGLRHHVRNIEQPEPLA